MSTLSLAKRYSQALFDLASEKGVVEETRQELAEVVKVYVENDELKKVIDHKLISSEVKQKVFKKIFGDKISSITLNFLFLLVQKNREYLLEDTVEQFSELANQAAGKIKADVKSAVELSDKQLEELRKKLSKSTGKDVAINMQIDESILGGMVVKIGDTIIDGSISNRLKLMEKHLKSVEFI